MNPLTKQSSEADIKAYFAEVLNLSRSNEDFPVNLDDVWQLVYTEKGNAVRALKSNNLFIEGIDFILLVQNDKQDGNGDKQDGKSNSWGGSNQVTYMLSVPCLEFFIARKVRPVFEVYRQVFHKVASGEIVPSFKMDENSKALDAILAPFAHFHGIVMERWNRVIDLSNNNASIVKFAGKTDELYHSYRYYLRDLVFVESIERVEGRNAIM